MSERPTPETDAEYKEAKDYEPSAFVEPLAKFLAAERERDEARMAGVGYSQQTVDAITNEREQLRRERDEARKIASELAIQAERLRKGRDEARKELSLKQQTLTIAEGTLCDLRQELDEVRAERDILRLDAQREAEHHDRMVGELEKVYKERDKARNKMADALREVDLWTLDFECMKQERDEARELAQQMSESNQVLMADAHFYRNALEQLKDGAK